MFDELIKYKNKNHFFFSSNQDLSDVCNAPKNASGIYLVYELKNGRIELVYIGSSGKVQNDGQIKHRDGGMFDSIVNGPQFGGIPRKESWKQKLIDEGIDALDVYWYETVNDDVFDIPAFVEAQILQKFLEVSGRIPRWNGEI